MGMSGLIFVALAIAWAVYLIPKALRHHEDDRRGRSVERFSGSLRVLARREPVSPRKARLVVPTPRWSSEPSRGSSEVETPEAPRRSSEGSRRSSEVETRSKATKRRRRVLGVLLLALIATVAVAATSRIAWGYVAIPAGLLVVWLLACRLMVKKERAVRRRPARRSSEVETQSTTRRSSEVETPASPNETTGKVPLVADSSVGDSSAVERSRDHGLWDPVPVTLPTYVSKPAARRTVRTIDLDSTGVWTSGRSESDSALAREAEAADRVRRSSSRTAETGDEAVGS